MQHQHTDDGILHRDQRRLAIGAERKPLSRVIRQASDEAARFEEVGQEADAGCGARGDQFEDLRDLDDRGRADDADPEGFRDEEFEAGRGGEGVDV